MGKLHLYFLAVLCFGVAGITLMSTTGMSVAGLTSMFPDTPGIAYLGYAVALGAVVLASVAGHMLFHKNWIVGVICTVLATILIIGEFQINDHSTGDTALEQVSTDSEAVAKYNAASERKQDLATEIAEIVGNQKIILNAKPNPATGNAEIKAAQRIMKNAATKTGEPVYTGLIDGKEEGLTQTAMERYAAIAAERLATLRKQQADDRVILDLGKPVVKEAEVITSFSKFIALFATLLAAILAIIGDLLLSIAMSRKEVPAEVVAALSVEYAKLLNTMGGDEDVFADDHKVVAIRKKA